MARVLGRTFGDELIEDVTTEWIERWKADFTREHQSSNRTLQKYLVTLHEIFKRATRVYGLPRNPVASVERPRLPRRAGIDVFSREEVMALVRAAESERDGALYLPDQDLDRPRLVSHLHDEHRLAGLEAGIRFCRGAEEGELEAAALAP